MIKGYPAMSFKIVCDFCGLELENVIAPHQWAEEEALLLRRLLNEKYGWVQTTWGKSNSKMHCPKCAIKKLQYRFVV